MIVVVEEGEGEKTTWRRVDGWLCWNVDARLEAVLVEDLTVQKLEGGEICGEEEEVCNGYSWSKEGQLVVELVARGGSKIVVTEDTTVEEGEEQLKSTTERERKEAGKNRGKGLVCFSNFG